MRVRQAFSNRRRILSEVSAKSEKFVALLCPEEREEGLAAVRAVFTVVDTQVMSDSIS